MVAVGYFDGDLLGTCVGLCVGPDDGNAVGAFVLGNPVGDAVGQGVGAFVLGSPVGAAVGQGVGARVGRCVGNGVIHLPVATHDAQHSWPMVTP